MENIFQPTKWFVLFCALLVVVWVCLQTVANMRVADESKFIAQKMLTWQWTDQSWGSSATAEEAMVVKRGNTEAVVDVRGHQEIVEGAKKDQFPFDVRMVFYRQGKEWVLGSFEFK